MILNSETPTSSDFRKGLVWFYNPGLYKIIDIRIKKVQNYIHSIGEKVLGESK